MRKSAGIFQYEQSPMLFNGQSSPTDENSISTKNSICLHQSFSISKQNLKHKNIFEGKYMQNTNA